VTAIRTPDRALSSRRRSRKISNAVAAGLIGLMTLLVLIPLFAIMIDLVVKGVGALNLDFFIKDPVPVGETGGGMRNAIVGTLQLVGIASVISVIIGIAGGIMLSEFPRSRLVPTIRLVSDVLSGIPAIVMGLVAYGLVVIAMKKFSALSGGIALGFLMIPIVVRTTEEVLKLIPMAVREAGLALGLPQWRVILSVVLPAALGGIITGIMLAIARVAGEAAPLLFTAFGNPRLNLNPLEPSSALPLQIFVYATGPYEEWHRLAYAGALVLIVLILVTSLLARWATRRR